MLETASDVVLNGRKRAAIDLDNEIKKRARSRVNTIQPYEDVRWIPPTSVIVERFFSGVKCIIGYLRKSLDTTTLEVIMYLTLDWDLVHSIVEFALELQVRMRFTSFVLVCFALFAATCASAKKPYHRQHVASYEQPDHLTTKSMLHMILALLAIHP
ncbi:hypothetical protein LEN26_012268, partial [Aphanomyces euteiches]